MNKTICQEEEASLAAEQKTREVDGKAALSPVLARLIDEVRNERVEGPYAYNRMHNRHNRSR